MPMLMPVTMIMNLLQLGNQLELKKLILVVLGEFNCLFGPKCSLF